MHALPEQLLDRVRADGRDVSGNPVERMTATGGEPLRCCLRNADPGEEVMLFGYEPPLPASPYREIGAVFAHTRPCHPVLDGRYPPAWYERVQVLRAYDRRGWIHPASRLHSGGDLHEAITEIFTAPDVHQIHSRNVSYGCYLLAITRVDE